MNIHTNGYFEYWLHVQEEQWCMVMETDVQFIFRLYSVTWMMFRQVMSLLIEF